MRRHTRLDCDWSSDVCSSDLTVGTTFDPVLGKGACATTTVASEQGTASYAFPNAKGKGYTMLGSPIIQARIAITGQFPLRSEERRVGEEGRSRGLPDHFIKIL